MKIQHLFFSIIFLSLFSCRTFTHADGSKSRSTFVRGDAYKKVDPEDLDQYLRPFDIENVSRELTIEKPSDIYFEEMTVPNIEEIAQQNKATLLVLWYPNCGSILQSVLDALNKGSKYRENPHFEMVLLSMSYDIPGLQSNLFMVKYTLLSYILPQQYGKTLIDKKINLGKKLCPPCYEIHKDDLSNVFVYLLDQEAAITSMHYSIYQKDLKRSVCSDLDKLDERINSLLESK